MSGVAQLAEFLVASWLLWRFVDRCYRGPLPDDPSALDDLPAAPHEPSPQLDPRGRPTPGR